MRPGWRHPTCSGARGPPLAHLTHSATSAAADEHMARLRAEAEAADKADRLRVAQEQLAEYASEKSEAAVQALVQVQALDAALSAALSGSSGELGSSSAALVAQLQQLKEQLAEAAAEAHAFAEQQRADVERLKRSSQQVSGWQCWCGFA